MAAPAPRGHYGVLGLTPGCAAADVKRAYRKLALRWHPDKNRGNEDEAAARFQAGLGRIVAFYCRSSTSYHIR